MKIDGELTQLFERFRRVPNRDSRAAAAGRAKFLDQAARLRMSTAQGRQSHRKGWISLGRPAFKGSIHLPALRILVASLLACVVFLGGSAGAVYAAQGSLPGEALYPIKTLGEDIFCP